MLPAKADIISQLKKDILLLQGLGTTLNTAKADVGLGPMNSAFPANSFPLGVVHEFVCSSTEDTAATIGFISGVLTSLMQNGRVCLWINSSRTVFPPALRSFGIEPDKIIFIDLQKEKDMLWVIEEALKCDGLAAVVGQIKEITFTASRRLQLAVEQSRVTGFIVRQNPRIINTTAFVSRWRITSLPAISTDDMPGVGFPKWNVELLKMRNGKTGSWEIMWMNGSFQHIYKPVSTIAVLQKKTG